MARPISDAKRRAFFAVMIAMVVGIVGILFGVQRMLVPHRAPDEPRPHGRAER